MTTLNDFVVTNFQQSVLDEYINRMLGSIFRKEISNAVMMTTDITLTDGDTPIQRLNCNGANRVVKVPPGANGNHPFLLINTTSSGSWTLTIKSNNGTVIYGVALPNENVLCFPDGNGGYKLFYGDRSMTPIAPTLLGTWVNYGGGYQQCGYYKDGFGIVRIHGLIKSGSAGSAIFVLPTGYRPQSRRMFVAIGNNAISRVDVLSDGTVIHVVGDTTFLSLDGITFNV